MFNKLTCMNHLIIGIPNFDPYILLNLERSATEVPWSSSICSVLGCPWWIAINPLKEGSIMIYNDLSLYYIYNDMCIMICI